MKYALAFVTFAVAALAVAAWLMIAHLDDGPAYTAQQVQAGMLQHPRQWFGHTIRLRGVVIDRALLVLPEQGNGPAIRYAIAGSDAQPQPAWDLLALPRDLWAPAAADPRAALVVDQGQAIARRGDWLRAIPLLNRLLPALQPDGHRMATYRVQLSNGSSARGCAARVCYWEILDAPPPSL